MNGIGHRQNLRKHHYPAQSKNGTRSLLVYSLTVVRWLRLRPLQHLGTRLVYAAKEGIVELVRDLLSRGADANEQGTFVSRGKPTLPIVLAAQEGNEEMIRLLINAGADPNGQDSEGI
jgi:hypothetical protein